MSAATNGSRPRVARIAVVGAGYWGPNLVRVLHELECAEVAAVCDSDPAALAKIAARFPGVEAVKSFDRLLDDGRLDAVAIATPVATHFELASAALEAGKHVFVEKPLAGSLAEAEALVALAERRGKVVMPGHTFLYSPPVNLVRDLIASGELGDIYFISTSRVNLGLHQSDVSVLWDLGPHDFSILRYWLAENPKSVSAIARSCIVPGIPDVAFVSAEYSSGTVAQVELSWLAPSKLRRTTVVGSRKMVVYDDTANEPVRIFDSGVSLPNPESFGQYKLSYRTGSIISPPMDTSEPLVLELEDFCAAVRGVGELRSSAALGVDVVRVIEAAERSVLYGGGLLDRRVALQQMSGDDNKAVGEPLAPPADSRRV